ncbi:MAG: DnaJ domain-containing protein [Acidimicrobiales bacterium]
MNPYEVLGVTPAAPIEEIEATYRLRLREWHPDLHQAEGPDAVAAAEARTRQLNAAMARIRQEFKEGGPGAWRAYDAPHAPGASAGASDAHGRGWWDTDYVRWYGYDRTGPFAAGERPGADAGGRAWAPPGPNEDWFDASASDEPVPCPYCGDAFDELDDFNRHLATAHQLRTTVYRRSRGVGAGLLDALGTLRFLPLWLVVPFAVLLTFLTPFWSWSVVWGVVALIMWAQTSRRFKRDRYSV